MTTQYKITTLKQEHLSAGYDLLFRTFSGESSRIACYEVNETLRDAKNSNGSQVLVATDADNRPVGLIMCRFLDNHPQYGKFYGMDWLVVHPEHKQRGLGRALSQAAEAYVQQKIQGEKATLAFAARPQMPLMAHFERSGYIPTTPPRQTARGLDIFVKHLNF